MKRIFRTAGLVGAVCASGAQADWDLYKPEEWIDITAHLRAVGGITDGDEVGALATHGHDPNQDVTIQAAEVSANFRLNDHIQGFANINSFLTTDDEIDAEWEEGFLKLVDLPGGFEVRGGRYLNRLGRQNNVHSHGWNFVDSNLTTTTFFGEEGLASEGAELSWIFGGTDLVSSLSVSFGRVVAHDHDHGHGEDEHDEHDEEEHHDEDEEHGDEDHSEEEGHEEDEHDHEHGHGGAEEAYFDEEVLTARWLLRWNQSDFHRHEFGVNFATGSNGYGRSSTLWGADYTYTWRQNGLESGGDYFSLGGEILFREVEWLDEEEGEEGDTNHFGLSVEALYGFMENWEAGLRFDYIDGAVGNLGDEVLFEVEERRRYSAALTRHFLRNEKWGALVRLQGNIDEFDDETELSAFLQVGIDFGGAEIR